MNYSVLFVIVCVLVTSNVRGKTISVPALSLFQQKEQSKARNTKTPSNPPKPILVQQDSLMAIHDLWNQILQKYVSEKGGVDYLGIKKNAELAQYIDLLSKNSPKEKWSKQEKLAYWINAYNALTIDLILRHYPIERIKDIKDPWDQRLWQFGEKKINLNEIEHEILREMDEPRIHFAIVCASESCPKLQNKAYNAETLDEQLTVATQTFLSDTSKNELSRDQIKLSKIFKWFAKDFKQNGSLIDFLNQYSEVQISKKAKKSYKAYNWDLND